MQKNRQVQPKNAKPAALSRKELRKLKQAQGQSGGTLDKNSDEEKKSSEVELHVNQDELEDDLPNVVRVDEAPLELPPPTQEKEENVKIENTLKKTNNIQFPYLIYNLLS